MNKPAASSAVVWGAAPHPAQRAQSDAGTSSPHLALNYDPVSNETSIAASPQARYS
jgi:hypothetical protein